MIPLSADEWHGQASETVWAEKLGPGKYRVRSIPFYATALSVDDVVTATALEGAEVLQKVILRGGHSTYRVFLTESIEPEDQRFQAVWQPFQIVGCRFERATERLFSIDVPPSADVHHVFRLLEDAEKAGFWHFEEGHYAGP